MLRHCNIRQIVNARSISNSIPCRYPLSFFKSKDAFQSSIMDGEKLVQVGGAVINPKELLGKDLSLLTENIRKLLGTGHPIVKTISSYYFSKQGKHIRPLIVLLISQATNKDMTDMNQDIDSTVSVEKEYIVKFEPTEHHSTNILPSQRRLAEITEMIHTASLLHDDVIDISMTRRNSATANAEFGNKMAILAGDFLLARASLALARLRNLEVVELLATVISNLVEGEFMQLRNSALDSAASKWTFPSTDVGFTEDTPRFNYYMEKTYMKTASLIAKSCQAATVLGGCSKEVNEAAYNYGKNIGLAFQVNPINTAC
jgi:hexaprenyl-diphosphate synthase